jgi:hypothetical protein
MDRVLGPFPPCANKWRNGWLEDVKIRSLVHRLRYCMLVRTTRCSHSRMALCIFLLLLGGNEDRSRSFSFCRLMQNSLLCRKLYPISTGSTCLYACCIERLPVYHHVARTAEPTFSVRRIHFKYCHSESVNRTQKWRRTMF